MDGLTSNSLLQLRPPSTTHHCHNQARTKRALRHLQLRKMSNLMCCLNVRIVHIFLHSSGGIFSSKCPRIITARVYEQNAPQPLPIILVSGCRCNLSTISPKYTNLESRRHRKSHDRPVKCNIGGCSQGFAFKRDRNRHIVAKHPQAATVEKYFCQNVSCERALNGAKGGFSRKDSLTRHLKTHQRKVGEEETELDE